MKGIRKRYLVSEGDLFMLYAQIQEVRQQEARDGFMKDFKTLLKQAQEVVITPKNKTS